MERRFNWVLVLVVLVSLCVGGWTVVAQRERTSPTQWEYTVKHSGNTDKTPGILNELGAQGWETR